MGHLKIERLDELVQLNWNTYSELNNDYFEIQLSSDGFEWEVIGEVDGNGTTSETIRYSFIDKTFPITDVLYYRLKQVDYDGNYEYSEIVSTVNPKLIEVSVFPNPTQGEVKIYLGDSYESVGVTIFNTLSEVIKTYNFNNTNHFSITLEETNGIYFIDIRTNEGSSTIMKLIKQ